MNRFLIVFSLAFLVGCRSEGMKKWDKVDEKLDSVDKSVTKLEESVERLDCLLEIVDPKNKEKYDKDICMIVNGVFPCYYDQTQKEKERQAVVAAITQLEDECYQKKHPK